MAGVAREVAAILDLTASVPAQVPEESGAPASEQCSVAIADDSLCPRYTARVIRGVKIGPSPQWLAEKIVAAGARPINNVVDISNYVMFELGQPLHAFDMDTLTGTDGRVEITVRRATAEEKLTTLDGVERQLTSDTLAICDPTGPVALAGVMGGEATEVSESTVNVPLESACFDPASISRTSRSLGLVSEASMRFERTVDRTACVAAADRAAALIAEIGGGSWLRASLTPIRSRSHRITSHCGPRAWSRYSASTSRAARSSAYSRVLGARSSLMRTATRSTSPASAPTSSARSTLSRRCCGCTAWS